MSTEKDSRRIAFEETVEAMTCVAVAAVANVLSTVPLASSGHVAWASLCGGASAALGWAAGYSVMLHFYKD